MDKLINMSDKDYFASEGVSNSFLKEFDRSPAHAMHFKIETSATQKGTLLHRYMLEKNFWDSFIVAPVECLNRRNKPFPEFKKNAGDKEILLHTENSASAFGKKELEIIADKIYRYKLDEGLYLEDVFFQAQKEIAFFREDDNGILQKGKLDLLLDRGSDLVILDLKKVQDCTDFHFNIKRYKYYRQAAYYSDNIAQLLDKPVTAFLFITVEEKEPYGVKVFKLDDSYLEWGREKNRKSLDAYKEWVDAGKKETCYDEGIEIIVKGEYYEY